MMNKSQRHILSPLDEFYLDKSSGPRRGDSSSVASEELLLLARMNLLAMVF
jgi:hypothetical protein